MLVALCSGALAGLLHFAIQHFTIVPLILEAERYEQGEDHHAHEWKPEEGWERTGWTALTTVLTGIGFAAVLFGFLGVSGRTITIRQGALWGLAAFTCFHLLPSIGLPPLPPGMPVPDVQPRQLWWLSTALSGAAGLWLIITGNWLRKIAGLVCLAVPHLIGAPAIMADTTVPAQLVRNFAILSLTTTAIFWITLGALGGMLSKRID